MFITIEGIDGSGKSTLAELVVALLRKNKKETIWTREPGDWTHGKAIRNILLTGELKSELAELLLFVADRCEHVKNVLEPAMAQGRIVVCERYNDSTRAYQCWGRGISRDKLEDLFLWCSFPEPDLTLLLDLDIEEAQQRVNKRSVEDRIEREQRRFHERVAEGFQELAKEYPQRIIRLDAHKSPSELVDEVAFLFRGRSLI